jgi:putative transcriptional regulator
MTPRLRMTEIRGPLTQAEVARRAGITRPFYSMIESGVRTPSLPIAKQLADTLGTTIDDLFFGDATQCNQRGTAR